MTIPTLGWSQFARSRHYAGSKHTWFEGSEAELLDLVRGHWDSRLPGAGQTDLSRVVLVPVPPDGFVCSTVRVDDSTPLHACFDRRQVGEDGFVRVTAEGPREPAHFAHVVLYSAEAVQENDGQRSGDFDWEVVCLIASPVADEPMHPLTMARNLLEKPGGTYCEYSAREFAAAVYYWSQRASVHVETE